MKKINLKKSVSHYRFKIPKIIRLSILGILSIILLITLVQTNEAYQQKPIRENEVVTSLYYHTAQFDYNALLQNNEVYNKTILAPAEGTYFVNILEYINASFTYKFESTNYTTVQGIYSINAKIVTEHWQKNYVLIPNTSFNFSGRTNKTMIHFIIDYHYYNDVLENISDEIGIKATDPILLITSQVSMKGETIKRNYTDSITHFISFSLDDKIIETSGDLNHRESTSFTKMITSQNPEVFQQQNQWKCITTFFSIITPAFFLITSNKIDNASNMEKHLKQISKKYGEWIVKSNKKHHKYTKNIIPLETMDDLQKVSEELAKPIVQYNESETLTTFLVIDEKHKYQYQLTPEDIKEKNVFSYLIKKPTLNKLKKSKMQSMKKPEGIKYKKPVQTKKHFTKIITCNHCKSSFTVDEETKEDIKKIHISCPHCGAIQEVYLTKPLFFSFRLKEFLQNRLNQAD